MACGLDGPPLHMGDDARLYRSYNVVCVAYPDGAVPSFLPYAQQIFVERNRLAGRIAHLRDDAPRLVHLCLWRLLQMVRKPAYKNGRCFYPHPCGTYSPPTDSQPLPLR